MEDIYCKVCNGCGEDGCCSAINCKQHKDGLYCDTYLKDLKFYARMFKDSYHLINQNKEFDDILNKNIDKSYD